MLNKLLFKNQDRKQLIIAMIGAFMGITFLITSIHYLIKVNEFGEGTEILGPNTIIVQKKVTSSATLGLGSTAFSKKEIEKMQSLRFIENVQPVVANNFDVSFETADPLIPRFRTDVFIQTVDPDFIDADPNEWDWKKGDKSVPIIMPRDILVMMNTFASAKQINQVSEELAMKVKFKFTLVQGDKKEWVDAHIIGFTSEVSAILVPASFMEYGNVHYTDGSEQKITQVMLSGKEGQFGLVEEMLEAKGLESKESQMAIGRLKSILGTLILVILGVSVIAVLVSGLVLIQYMQLLMSRNAYEVRTLMRIGYHPKEIIGKFFFYFVRIFGIVMAIGLTIFFIMKYFLDNMFASGGLFIDQSMTAWSIIALIIAYVLFGLSSYVTAKRGIFKEY